MSKHNHIVFFIDDKMGGVSSLNYNLIKQCPAGITPLVIHINHADDKMAKAGINYPGCDQLYFKTNNQEHRLQALKRLRSLVPDQEGALILNYGTEMAMLDHFPVKQTTYQLVHDSYNVNLARKYGHVVDVFICHNTHIQNELQQLFPERKDDIFYLPHGIEMPNLVRQPSNAQQPLRLLFLGRMIKTKGIFDLPAIDRLLLDKGVSAKWGCVGSGPERDALQKNWQENSRVNYFSPATNAEVMKLIADYDVFVLPTKFEGSPVSLLETMGCGLVPVITRLPGGITDIVNDSLGFTPAIDDNEAFAEAIALLHHNRAALNERSQKCIEKIRADFDLIITAARYFDLMIDYKSHYHSKKLMQLPVGSRLDKKWVPAYFTYFIRKVKVERN